jgi:hypothetical protein
MAKKKEPKAVAPEQTKKVEIPAPEVAVSGPKWIKVNAEQLAKLQEEGRLVGYNPATEEALIK